VALKCEAEGAPAAKVEALIQADGGGSESGKENFF
jgi:hypothetical protein